MNRITSHIDSLADAMTDESKNLRERRMAYQWAHETPSRIRPNWIGDALFALAVIAAAILVACLMAGCGPIAPAGTATTQPITAQQQFDTIVADEAFAFAVATPFLSGQSLIEAQAADAAFRASAALVQAQISGGTLTPTQVAAALAADISAVKTVAAKAPKTVPAK